MRDWKKATRKSDNVVIFSPHISSEAKNIYNIIIGFSGKVNDKTYTPQIPIEELKQYSGLTKKKIIESTNELVALNLITKHQTTNNINRKANNQYEVLPITDEVYQQLTRPYVEQKQKPRGITTKQEVIQQNVEELDYDQEMIKKALLIEEQLKKLREEGY